MEILFFQVAHLPAGKAGQLLAKNSHSPSFLLMAARAAGRREHEALLILTIQPGPILIKVIKAGYLFPASGRPNEISALIAGVSFCTVADGTKI
jgi:hypothetical protein